MRKIKYGKYLETLLGFFVAVVIVVFLFAIFFLYASDPKVIEMNGGIVLECDFVNNQFAISGHDTKVTVLFGLIAESVQPSKKKVVFKPDCPLGNGALIFESSQIAEEPFQADKPYQAYQVDFSSCKSRPWSNPLAPDYRNCDDPSHPEFRNLGVCKWKLGLM